MYGDEIEPTFLEEPRDAGSYIFETLNDGIKHLYDERPRRSEIELSKAKLEVRNIIFRRARRRNEEEWPEKIFTDHTCGPDLHPARRY